MSTRRDGGDDDTALCPRPLSASADSPPLHLKRKIPILTLIAPLLTKPSHAAVAPYPSKLHEKLAFLEGKVKRIAFDIKKTLAKDYVAQDKVLSPVQDNSVVVEFLALIANEGVKVNAWDQVKAKGVGNGGFSERNCDIDEMLEADECSYECSP
ncbi:hypothetical protein Fmac_001058 [Flemingia macrophylla]|uniref:Uncharacterized protein n=1 Tax=Flemingia macrophylla TaxID=520843 RepID=A0ABD1NHK8_9FABA